MNIGKEKGMSNHLGETEYIITKSKIFNTVRGALECDFARTEIIDLLMKNIENDIEIILEDDCEEMTDEMWERLKS